MHLFVSAYAAPHLPRPQNGIVHELPEAELIEHVVGLDGTSRKVLEHPELVGLVLPALRADYAVCETYRHPKRAQLPVPITAFGGLDDRQADYECLAAWQELTARHFAVSQFPGATSICIIIWRRSSPRSVPGWGSMPTSGGEVQNARQRLPSRLRP